MASVAGRENALKLQKELSKLFSMLTGSFRFKCDKCHELIISQKGIKLRQALKRCQDGENCKFNFVYIQDAGDDSNTIQRIRQKPKHKFYGHFVMCNKKNGKPCSAKKCTFAHCKVELYVWNFLKKNPNTTYETISKACEPARSKVSVSDAESDSSEDDERPGATEVRDKRPFVPSGKYTLCKR